MFNADVLSLQGTSRQNCFSRKDETDRGGTTRGRSTVRSWSCHAAATGKGRLLSGKWMKRWERKLEDEAEHFQQSSRSSE